MKTIGRALDASVNDLLLSCVAGALRDYLRRARRRGRCADDARARPGQPAADGEGVQARQPVRPRVPRPADRHRESRSSGFTRCAQTCARSRVRTSRCWRSACWRRWAPDRRLLQDAMLKALARNATAVMTNVPGPAIAAVARGRAHRQPDVLGAAVGRYRPRRVDPLLQRRCALRRGRPIAACVPTPTGSARGSPTSSRKLVLATLMSPWPRDGDLDPDVAAQSVGPRPRSEDDGRPAAQGHAG